MDQVLFSIGTVQGLNKRFPQLDKISIFDGSELVPEMTMASMDLKPVKELTCSRSGTKLYSASLSGKPCLVRYIDVTQNVETQTDTLAYLSLLKTIRHSQLEEMSLISVIDIGTGRGKETKVIRP
jgi:hypothetical protein